ncbi:MAG: hypothetical protein AB1742_12945 [bacterium]
MRNVAIIGVGYTPVFVSKRKDVNIPEMIREAVQNVFRRTNAKPEDVEALVVGNMQTFEGVNLPHLWAGDHIGGLNKPVMRIATGGTTGMTTFHAAYYHVASGLFDVVMAIGWEKHSEGDAQVGLGGIVLPEVFGMIKFGPDISARPGGGGGGGGFGLGGGGGSTGGASFQAMSYMARSGCTVEHIDKVAAMLRRNAAGNPYAHLKHPGCTAEDIAKTPMIAYPLRYGHTCPTTDGATAVILTTEEKAKKLAATDRVAWVKGLATCASDATTGNIIESQITDPAEQLPCRIASKKAYEMAGITDPKKEIDLAEVYDGFAHQDLMWPERLGLFDEGKCPEALDRGRMDIDGDMPVNLSGGVISTNAIGASAMNRVTECALQVMGTAEGGHQAHKKVNTAVAHGWGGLFQFVSVTVVGRTPNK